MIIKVTTTQMYAPEAKATIGYLTSLTGTVEGDFDIALSESEAMTFNDFHEIAEGLLALEDVANSYELRIEEITIIRTGG